MYPKGINSDLLAEVDETWKKEGFNSRSEFIRQTLRDAVDEPDVSAALQRLLVSAQQAQKGDFVEREAIREEFLNE